MMRRMQTKLKNPEIVGAYKHSGAYTPHEPRPFIQKPLQAREQALESKNPQSTLLPRPNAPWPPAKAANANAHQPNFLSQQQSGPVVYLRREHYYCH